MRIQTVLSVGLSLVVLFASRAIAQDWPRFRGPNGSGISETSSLPTQFDRQTNVLWKVAVGPGLSSPVVVGKRVFFTSYEDDDRTLHCLDATSGETLWSHTVHKVRDENTTRPSGPATSTPASDGRSVVVFFPDVGLLGYTVEGESRWHVELPPFRSLHGISSSPVLAGNKVMLVVDQLTDSYIAAYDLDSGAQCWRNDRPNGVTGGYSTPAVYEPAGGPAQVIVAGPMQLIAYNSETGERIWWVTGMTNAPVGVPIISGQRVFVCEPVGEPIPMRVLGVETDKDGKIVLDKAKQQIGMYRLLDRIDREWGNADGAVEEAEWDRAIGTFVSKGGLVAIDLGGSQDVTDSHVRWSYKKTLPYIPSVLLYDELLYVVRDGGILTTIDPVSGEVLRTERLKATGQYYASPVAGGDKVVLVNTDGKLTVLSAGRNWEVLATNDLGEPCHATPAIANNRIYVRTSGSLFCFGR